MRTGRRTFLGGLGAAAAGPRLGRAAERGRPNILFVFADQLRAMELGCYGGAQARTPNLDRLAREGVRFTNAISTAPVCSPFRAMLLTGNHPFRNGMVYNDHFLRNPTPAFGAVCRGAGYRTGYIGKWHVDGAGRAARIPPERRLGFDFWRAYECTHAYFKSPYYHQDEERPRAWPGYDADAQTDEACRFIREQGAGRPFCLFLSWGPPHDPYVAPDEYLARFDPATLRLRENVDDFAAAEALWRACDTALPAAHEKTRQAFLARLRDPSNRAIREWYRGYLAALEALDDNLGKLLRTLEERGQLDNTILVFTSDHGDNLGSHRQYGKQLPYEESIAIPFLVRYPAALPAGRATDALLAPTDMMPTVLGLAGVEGPAVDGVDLSEVARGRRDDARDAVLIQKSVWLSTNWITNGNGPWRGVRTKRHTYARRSDTRQPWMLFDNRADPQQVRNLAGRPEAADLVAALDRRTSELLAEAGDPEDPAAVAARIMGERRARGLDPRAAELAPARVPAGSGFAGV